MEDSSSTNAPPIVTAAECGHQTFAEWIHEDWRIPHKCEECCAEEIFGSTTDTEELVEAFAAADSLASLIRTKHTKHS